MSTHYCIGIPCWICFPEHKPKFDKNIEFWEETIQDRYIPTCGVSGLLKNLLTSIFEQGLDEDTHYYEMYRNKITYDMLLEEINNCVDRSFEKELLTLLIDDLKDDEERDKIGK